MAYTDQWSFKNKSVILQEISFHLLVVITKTVNQLQELDFERYLWTAVTILIAAMQMLRA